MKIVLGGFKNCSSFGLSSSFEKSGRKIGIEAQNAEANRETAMYTAAIGSKTSPTIAVTKKFASMASSCTGVWRWRWVGRYQGRDAGDKPNK